MRPAKTKKDTETKKPSTICCLIGANVFIALIALVAIAIAITAIVKVNDVGTQCQAGLLDVTASMKEIGSNMKQFQKALLAQ